MRKVLLILLMLIVPLQAFAAMERTLAHVLGSGSGKAATLSIKHVIEHELHVMHHHDDDGDESDDDHGTHVDSSQKSAQHLADFDQGFNPNVLLPELSLAGFPVAGSEAPFVRPDSFSNRHIHPLLRPPRALT